jgi:hypothetical protein
VQYISADYLCVSTVSTEMSNAKVSNSRTFESLQVRRKGKSFRISEESIFSRGSDKINGSFAIEFDFHKEIQS